MPENRIEGGHAAARLDSLLLLLLLVADAIGVPLADRVRSSPGRKETGRG
ncbi:hypothetical protein [Streptomyces sp. G-G2]|nr:hypothetical protein [Streptomyces sp. G-G2]MDJ0382659.1 hypothetical protein [Streptomyces sp. G-G2]